MNHSLETPTEVIILGRLSTSQDAIVVGGGGYRHATPQDTEIRPRWPLSRIKPHNVCYGCVACTLNTRYEDAAIKDYITLRHYPKTVVMAIYET